MSPSSVRAVNKILCRVNALKTHPDRKLTDFYSLEEQDERIRLKTDFQDQILRISDNLYAYDRYLLPINHFEPCVFVYRHGIDEVRDQERIRRGDILDVGGFIGDSALVLSDRTDGRIYSFEANPRNAELMKKTLEINGLTNVTPVPTALWSAETELELTECGSASSVSKLPGIRCVTESYTVRATTGDHFVTERHLRVGLIKVDLEGAELEFLKGAKATLQSQKPVLLLSIYHKPEDFFELKPLLESWVPEYEFTVYNPVDWGILLETLLIAQPRGKCSADKTYA